MSNITVGQLIMDAQRMASRVKDLDTLSSSLLVEAEGNNRLVESLRQFQEDIDSLNRISNNKSNVEMVTRIQQQNASSSEILKENRELKICVEDYERALELIMQKYRDHTSSKILESKINFKDVDNDKLWKIIREQRDKIDEMAAVMQRAAAADDDEFNREIENMNRLRLENKTLRELLQISREFGSDNRSVCHHEHNLEEKGVQTDADDSADELSLSGASIENTNNNSVVQVLLSTSTSPALGHNTAAATAIVATDNASMSRTGGDNNNGPATNIVTTSTQIMEQMDNGGKDAPSVINSSSAVSTTVPTVSGCLDVTKPTAATAT